MITPINLYLNLIGTNIQYDIVRSGGEKRGGHANQVLIKKHLGSS